MLTLEKNINVCIENMSYSQSLKIIIKLKNIEKSSFKYQNKV